MTEYAGNDLKRFPRWFWASCSETTVAFLSACLTLFTLSWLSLHRCVNDQIPFRDMHDLLASSCLVFESLICPWWFETLSPLILSILQWDNDSVPECMLDNLHFDLVEFCRCVWRTSQWWFSIWRRGPNEAEIPLSLGYVFFYDSSNPFNWGFHCGATPNHPSQTSLGHGLELKEPHGNLALQALLVNVRYPGIPNRR